MPTPGHSLQPSWNHVEPHAGQRVDPAGIWRGQALLRSSSPPAPAAPVPSRRLPWASLPPVSQGPGWCPPAGPALGSRLQKRGLSRSRALGNHLPSCPESLGVAAGWQEFTPPRWIQNELPSGPPLGKVKIRCLLIQESSESRSQSAHGRGVVRAVNTLVLNHPLMH